MFRNDTQRNNVCITLLRSLHLDRYWTDHGPSPDALDLLAADGGPLSSGERIWLFVVFDVWNGEAHTRLDRVLYSLDNTRLRALGSLLLAMANGQIDGWLKRSARREPIPPMSAIYYPTYDVREDLDADTASWLLEQQGDGPLDLATITDVCASCRVRATLRDAHGSVRGHVDADGNHRLG